MKNIPATKVSSIDLFGQARELLDAKHAENEKAKLGTLRGGSSGCMVGPDVIGTCHRKALVRFLGYDSHIDEKSKSIFDAGFGNEAIWESNMKEVSAVRCEEEIPIEWETSNGIKVTGRPDVVLGTEDDEGNFTPTTGLELKVIAAANSAAGMFYENKPKTDNLCQAAHYSMIMGIPFILVYSFNGKADIPWWAKKRFGVPKEERHIEPFKREFNLGWDNGRLYYIEGNTGNRVETDITQEGIREFYDLIPDMADKKDLYLRFQNRDFKGGDGPFSMCNYCDWQSACDLGEDDFDTWLDFIKRDSK